MDARILHGSRNPVDLQGLSCQIPTQLITVGQRAFPQFLHNTVCVLNHHLHLGFLSGSEKLDRKFLAEAGHRLGKKRCRKWIYCRSSANISIASQFSKRIHLSFQLKIFLSCSFNPVSHFIAICSLSIPVLPILLLLLLTQVYEEIPLLDNFRLCYTYTLPVSFLSSSCCCLSYLLDSGEVNL